MTMIRMAGSSPRSAFWLMTPNENACEIASILGYGTAIIDMEHGTFEPCQRRAHHHRLQGASACASSPASTAPSAFPSSTRSISAATA